MTKTVLDLEHRTWRRVIVITLLLLMRADGPASLRMAATGAQARPTKSRPSRAYAARSTDSGPCSDATTWR